MGVPLGHLNEAWASGKPDGAHPDVLDVHAGVDVHAGGVTSDMGFKALAETALGDAM